MPRLPKGMYRRRDAFYCRLYDEGREVRRSLGGDFEQAKRKLRALRAGRGEVVQSTVTVSEAVERWLKTAVRTGRNPQGQRNAKSQAKRHIVPLLGMRRVATLKETDLRAFRLDLEEHGCSRSLVHHVLTDLRALLRWCEESGLIQKAPVPRRWLPRLEERAPDRLTEAEFAAVSAIADPYGFVVRLALGTGLRWGELARLDASDIWQGVIIVRQSKSGKVRRVPVPVALMRELRGKHGPLVPFRTAKVLAAGVRRLSGIKRFHMHQTRHTFACRYLERGGSLHALQQLLGHSTVLVTQRYGRLSDEAVFAECRRIEDQSDWGAKPAQIPAQGSIPEHSRTVITNSK